MAVRHPALFMYLKLEVLFYLPDAAVTAKMRSNVVQCTVMRIYLDNCALNRPYDDQSRIRIRLESEAELYTLEEISNQRIELVWSYIIDYENSLNPYPEKQRAIFAMKKHAVADVEESNRILQVASILRKKGLKAFDALHVACAVHGGCSFFVTTDDQMLKKLGAFDTIKVINPVQFISIMEAK